MEMMEKVLTREELEKKIREIEDTLENGKSHDYPENRLFLTDNLRYFKDQLKGLEG